MPLDAATVIVPRRLMALISLSDWLDRFGDAPTRIPSTSELDSLRFGVDELPARPDAAAASRGSASWRDRLRRRWERAFWRLKRASSGQA